MSADKKDLSVSFPIHFRSLQSFFKTSIRLTKSSFSVYFQLRTSLLNGLIMLTKDEKQSFLFCVEIHHGKIRYVFKVDGETKVLQRPLNVSDGNLHEVHIQRPSCHHNILRVDDSASPSYTSGRSLPDADDSECEIHIGGTSGYMYGVLPDEVHSTDGYTGCMSSIDLDGNPWSLVMDHTLLDDKFKDQIVHGCDEEGEAKSIIDFLRPEKSCECHNGGICMDSACDCKLTSYSGPTCDEESESFNFSSGSVIVFRYQASERPDSTDNVVALGVKTLRSNSTLVTIADEHFKNFIKISLSSGEVRAIVSLNRRTSEINSNAPKISDGEYHVIRFFRVGSWLTLQVDDHPRLNLNRSEHHQDEVFSRQSKIIIGGFQRGHDLLNDFNGLLAGVYVDRMFLFEMVSRRHSGVVKFGSLSNGKSSPKHASRPPHKGGTHVHSRSDRLQTNPGIKRLMADDDIIVPTLHGSECEDLYDTVPEFCEHNLSDDSFVFPSYTTMRVTWKPVATTLRPTQTCNTSSCVDLSSAPPVKDSLQPRMTAAIKTELHVVDRLFTLDSYDHTFLRNSISDDILISRKFLKKEDEAVQENFNSVIPDHLVSSMVTNVLLTIGISMSSIVLVVVMLYVARKCSKTKKNEVFIPEEINKFITHSPPQVSTQSFLNTKHQSSENYVKEWFI